MVALARELGGSALEGEVEVRLPAPPRPKGMEAWWEYVGKGSWSVKGMVVVVMVMMGR